MTDNQGHHPTPLGKALDTAWGIICLIILIGLVILGFGALSTIAPNHDVNEGDLIAPLPTEIQRVR